MIPTIMILSHRGQRLIAGFVITLLARSIALSVLSPAHGST
jgi:hypothetical protein